jgi:hypothetical protein
MHRLALALGKSVSEMLDSMSYEELCDWGLYFQIEPWGEWRDDLRSAQVAAVIANANRDPKRRPEAFQITDFMLFEKREEEYRRELEAHERAQREGDTRERGEPAPQPEPADEDGAKIDPTVVAWLWQSARAKAPS